MQSVAQAAERIVDGVEPLPPERVGLLDAMERVLATPAVAPYTLPHWDNSAMDGYAVVADDLEGASAEAPVELRVVDSVMAGQTPSRPIGRGEATRIMTGAPLPQGADTVVRVEDTDAGTTIVRIRDARDARKNVRPRGEDFRSGDEVLSSGAVVGPAQIGVLASLGLASVWVHRRPRVAIVGSGDELVDLDRFHEVLAGHRIVSSNSYTLAALVRRAGGIPVDLGVAPDTLDALRALLERTEGADLVVTSAGASVGESDFTRQALLSLGAELAFWRVRMRPGAPLGFGTLRGKPWLGLPGNPVSAMVTFELFARPLIRKLLGHRRLHRQPVAVILDEPVHIGARLTHFLRAIVHVGSDGALHARLTGPQGSGILTSMSKANALLVVPEDRPQTPAGERLHALLLGDEAQLADRFSLGA
jgi:molybdopterin molybdotransferase